MATIATKVEDETSLVPTLQCAYCGFGIPLHKRDAELGAEYGKEGMKKHLDGCSRRRVPKKPTFDNFLDTPGCHSDQIRFHTCRRCNHRYNKKECKYFLHFYKAKRTTRRKLKQKKS